MKVSPVNLARLLTRLPVPRRASLQDLGHAAAMLARAGRTYGPHPAVLAERLVQLADWLDAASTHFGHIAPPSPLAEDGGARAPDRASSTSGVSVGEANPPSNRSRSNA